MHPMMLSRLYNITEHSPEHSPRLPVMPLLFPAMKSFLPLLSPSLLLPLLTLAATTPASLGVQ